MICYQYVSRSPKEKEIYHGAGSNPESFEKSGDKLMKMILATVAFAALMAPPLFAQSPRNEGPASRIYLNQRKQFGVNNRDRYTFAPRSNQDATDNSLCSTAHDFCPGFHGDNG
jgi:hypothetical protein